MGGRVMSRSTFARPRRSLRRSWQLFPALLLVGTLARVLQAAPPATADQSSSTRPDGAVLEKVEAQNKLSAAALLAEVDYGLRQARTRMGNDPAGAEQDLRLLIERVAKAPQLSAVARANVRGRLTTAMREAQRRAITRPSLDEQEQAEAAGTQARLRLEDDTTRRQERVRQLTERYQALLDEGRPEEAKRLADTELRQAAPDSAAAKSGPLVAEAIGNRAAEKSVRDAKTQAMFEAYNAEQRAAIPGSDDPGIVYPDAAVWKKLTAYRLAHTAPDNRKLSPAEVKIYKALKEPTTIDFAETPLADAVDYLRDLHGIEIQLDSKELEQMGIHSETPVTRKVSGIPLRSALRLLLGQLDLSYLVTEDVILITTRDKASRAVDTRIYPVGDIIFPRDPLWMFRR